MRGVVTGLLALLLAAGPARAADWTLAALMEALAANPGGRVRFIERKFLALLDAPLEAGGELVYRPPGRLERHTYRPQPESMVLDGDTLVLERDGRRLQLSLAEHPQIGIYVDSIRQTLAGERDALERSYVLALDGEAGLWTLRLEPRDAALRALIRQITITGSEGRVRAIAILQDDGDRSELTLQAPVTENPH